MASIREQVRQVLADNISTRNSDEELTIEYWRIYHDIEGPDINIRRMFGLPTIKQLANARSYIQNKDRQYLPTIWEVAKKRKWDREEWEEMLGYKVYDPSNTIW